MKLLCESFGEAKTFACIISWIFIGISVILIGKSLQMLISFQRRDAHSQGKQKIVIIFFIMNLLSLTVFNIFGDFIYNNLHMVLQDVSLLYSFGCFYASLLTLMGADKTWKRVRLYAIMLGVVYTVDCGFRFYFTASGYCKYDWLNIFRIGKSFLALIFGVMGLKSTNTAIKKIEEHIALERHQDENDGDEYHPADEDQKKALRISMSVDKFSGMNVKFLVEQLALIIFVISILSNIVQKVIIYYGVTTERLQSCTMFISLAIGDNLTFFDKDISFFQVCELSFFYLRKIFDVYLPITLILWIYQQMLNAGKKTARKTNLDNFRSDEIKETGYMKDQFSRSSPRGGSSQGSRKNSIRDTRAIKQMKSYIN